MNRSWGYSHLNFSVYDNEQEIPDGSRDSSSRKFTKQISEEDTLRPIVNNDELNSYDINAIHQHVQHYRIFRAIILLLEMVSWLCVWGTSKAFVESTPIHKNQKLPACI